MCLPMVTFWPAIGFAVVGICKSGSGYGILSIS